MSHDPNPHAAVAYPRYPYNRLPFNTQSKGTNHCAQETSQQGLVEYMDYQAPAHILAADSYPARLQIEGYKIAPHADAIQRAQCMQLVPTNTPVGYPTIATMLRSSSLARLPWTPPVQVPQGILICFIDFFNSLTPVTHVANHAMLTPIPFTVIVDCAIIE
ncbi:hypothetical protein M406DRAFT_329910 [Cryphonectria parasitica EP155]|uniref:Uncharacterized protein n=1 Tax=Cryphonectria parasitica (strain ATCC 38755 / EP155) TaxID=660469 RepID=A0A9P5CQ38_CRYP1|nr:uncharacterized protein M406DRAFT_329910 [Cryphonectria parasitica EP155]KAF3766067.1 hypothetical protein M406DRAFT_329910 [Cryphonectria parasitica EP155]